MSEENIKKITPRPYQVECIDAMFKSMIDGNEFGLVVLPTGGGKTVIFSSFIEEVYKRYEKRKDKIRICIVAHRERLVEQARDKLLKVWPGSADRIGMACASLSKDINIDSEIVICSIQTLLSRLKSRGSDHIDPFDILLIDEAHRIPPIEKKSYYKRLIDLTKELSPKRKVFGFTATPYRLGHGYIYGAGCKHGETNFFPKITFAENMDSMIAAGYLVPYRIKRAIDIGPELRRVPIINGEYRNDVLGDIMCKFLNSAVGVYKKYGENRKHVVAFCVNIDHAEKLAQAFKNNGITCETIHSKLPMHIRNERLEAFSEGKLNVLASVDALIEGWDETSIDCLLMLRPTKSSMIYVQQGGRGLRTHEGKNNLLILDMADNFENHGFLAHPRVVIPGVSIGGEAPQKICPNCDLALHASVRLCPECGHVFLSKKVNEPQKVDMEEVHVPIQQNSLRGRKSCVIQAMKIQEHGNVLKFMFTVLNPNSNESIMVCHWISSDDMRRKTFPTEWSEMTNLKEIPRTISQACIMANNIEYPSSIYVNFTQKGKFFAGWHKKGWTFNIKEKKEQPEAGYWSPIRGRGSVSLQPPVTKITMKICPNCNLALQSSLDICPQCEYPLSQSAKNEIKNKINARYSLRGKKSCVVESMSIVIDSQNNILRFLFKFFHPLTNEILPVYYLISKNDIQNPLFVTAWNKLTNIKHSVPKTIKEAYEIANTVSYPKNIYVNFTNSELLFCGWHQKEWSDNIEPKILKQSDDYKSFKRSEKIELEPKYKDQTLNFNPNTYIQSSNTGFKDKVKQCPKCGTMLDKFVFLCSHCGHQFTMKRVSNLT